tara:strand:- start:674 stop:901 length:228 start_codon:yes stop_codon:yes gene_type:complete
MLEQKSWGLKISFISMKSVFQPGLRKPARFAKIPGLLMFSTPMEQNSANDTEELVFLEKLELSIVSHSGTLWLID